ncbi:MAG: hypothetical protein GY841_23535 [FCB group bacterium]|nr:hypothetical protein [FCB group bacterium]
MQTCPECTSSNLDYGTNEIQDDIRTYPFTCLDCGFKGKEIYREVFLEVEDSKGQHRERKPAADPLKDVDRSDVARIRGVVERLGGEETKKLLDEMTSASAWELRLIEIDSAIDRLHLCIPPKIAYRDAYDKALKAWGEFTLAHWG